MAKSDSDQAPAMSSAPPEAWEPLLRFARLASRPLERFLAIQASSGILLLIAAALALAWANSPWSSAYTELWHAPVGLRLGPVAFERSLEWVVNDGLMVIFFFVVGLEIRREMDHGELSEVRRAALPAAAALGGMLAPAGIYLLVVGAGPARAGWGVPMATDIAFAVGILALLGKRVPAALRVLLLALAVIDDLGAIVVIAVFYSSGISLAGFGVAGAAFLTILLMQRLGVRKKLAYLVPAVVAWAAIYSAGVHPTIAGVILGLLTPIRAWLGPAGFIGSVRTDLRKLESTDVTDISSHALAERLRQVDIARREAMSPAEALIEALHPWVAYGIMPVFALANAGVVISGGGAAEGSGTAMMGVVLGLFVGKPLGIVGATWLAMRLRVAVAPAGLTMRHIVVLGMVAGVGFTMALFIAQLAFAGSSLLAAAKLGVLGGSAGAGVTAFVLGRLTLSTETVAGTAMIADEAESSTDA